MMTEIDDYVGHNTFLSRKDVSLLTAALALWRRAAVEGGIEDDVELSALATNDGAHAMPTVAHIDQLFLSLTNLDDGPAQTELGIGAA